MVQYGFFREEDKSHIASRTSPASRSPPSGHQADNGVYHCMVKCVAKYCVQEGTAQCLQSHGELPVVVLLYIAGISMGW